MAQPVTRFGSVCDRCATPYAAITFPSAALCPGCNLATMTPWERGKLLGYIELTGEYL